MKTIFRTSKSNGNFVQVDNALINTLKPKELGLMLYFLSMPDYYKFKIEEIEGITSDGMKAIKSGIKELEKKGYIIKVKERDMLGQFKNDRYIIKECPKIEVNIENKDINIYRITKPNNFTLVDKGFIYDNRLSLDAKGILCYMLSKPNYWKFYASEIQKTLNVGRKIVEKSIKELQNFRYIRAKKINKRNIEYKIFEKPINAKMIYCKIFTAHDLKSTLPLPKKYITITQKVHYHKPKSTTNKNLIKNPIKNLYQYKSKSDDFDLKEKKNNIYLENNNSIDNNLCIEDKKDKQYVVESSSNDCNAEYKESNNKEDISYHYRDTEMAEKENDIDDFDDEEYIDDSGFEKVETVSTPIFELPAFLLRTENNNKKDKDDEFLNSFNTEDDNLNIDKEVLSACQENNNIDKEKITSFEVNRSNTNDNIEDEICQLPWESDEEYQERRKRAKEDNTRIEENALDVLKKLNNTMNKDDNNTTEDIEALKEKYRIYISDICEFTNEQIIGLAREFNYHEIEEFLEYIKSCQYSSMFEFITCSV